MNGNEVAAAEIDGSRPPDTGADEQQALLEDAERVAAALEESEHRLAALREERAIMIRKLRAANVSWPAIGKALNCTHQAAMYASGLVERSQKKPT